MLSADSITTVDCLALERDSPHICCEPKTGGFCLVQCNNGLCRCVNPTTGVPTADFTFTEDDDSIDCSLEQSKNHFIILVTPGCIKN